MYSALDPKRKRIPTMPNTVKDSASCAKRFSKPEKTLPKPRTRRIQMVNLRKNKIVELAFTTVAHSFTFHTSDGKEFTFNWPYTYMIFTLEDGESFCTRHYDEIYRWYEGLQ
jgi:hypothetical protein